MNKQYIVTNYLENKISNFFKFRDVLANPLGIEQTPSENRVVLYNTNYAASRMDLVKFTLNAKIEVITWYLNEEVANQMRVHEMSAHRKGLGIEFKVEGVKSKYVYELLKNKCLAKNTIEISFHELIYNEEKDTIFISFKTNISMEANKIGIIEKNKPMHFQYINKEKVKTGGTKKQGFKKPFGNTKNETSSRAPHKKKYGR